MIKQLIQDVKWRHLAISLSIAFFILLLSGSLLADFKSEAFSFSINKGIIEWDDTSQFEKSGNAFFESILWAPLHIISIIFAQSCSIFYLLKKSKKVELINGIAHGIFSAIFLYQLEAVSSLIGFAISFLLAYKLKEKNKENQ